MRMLVAIWAVLLIGCSDPPSANAPVHVSADGTAAAASSPANAVAANDNGSTRFGMNGRKAEIVNPDNSTVVFLYYDLAGLTPPLDRWVEDDRRVASAQPFDKAALRQSVRAELESAAASVRDIGFIRLSMHANLSDYDPSYGEFTVRALAPSSVVSFDALGQKVSLKFANGRTAQIWRVAPAQAAATRDKIGYFSNVSLDVLLRIAGVQPGPAGGTLVTEVVEYEMHETQRGLTVGRVRVE